MDRDEISGISKEFEEVLEQVSAGRQTAREKKEQPGVSGAAAGLRAEKSAETLQTEQLQSAAGQDAREEKIKEQSAANRSAYGWNTEEQNRRESNTGKRNIGEQNMNEQNRGGRGQQEPSLHSSVKIQETGRPGAGRVKAWKQPRETSEEELLYMEETPEQKRLPEFQKTVKIEERGRQEEPGMREAAATREEMGTRRENGYKEELEYKEGPEYKEGAEYKEEPEYKKGPEYKEEPEYAEVAKEAPGKDPDELSPESYMFEEDEQDGYPEEEHDEREDFSDEYSDGREEDEEEEDFRPAVSNGILHPSDGLIAAFFIPVIVLVVIFAQRGIFPFGQESFLRTDMYHQYAPFFSEFHHKLRSGGSLLYSWDIGMGVNFAALYAYYLASPLNWLVILCPKEYIIEFMTYMIVFKTGLCGLSFSYYLKKHNRTADFGVGFFGIFYALSGYMAAYSWNIMWLDCILLFPLIMLGLERLVKEKKGMLYCVTLGLSILSNYYISIMICLFMVIYFICLLIMEGKRRAKDFFISLVQFGGYSLIAGALAAFVLLPEIAALQTTASGDFNFPKTYEMYFSIIDMLARHIGNVQTEIGLDHWPNIYCGVAVFLFFLLYLACRKIPVKEKAVYCGLLLLFFASFSINVLNFIWHGFHYPNSLPCRQSFIYIFLILSMCYRAYMYLDETPKKHVAIAFWGSVCYVLLAQKFIKDEAYHFIVFYVAILFLAVYAGLIYFYKNPRRSRTTAALLTLAVVAVESAVNTTVTSITTTSRSAYKSDNEGVIELTKDLKTGNGFYRVDKVDGKTKNDGAWMNFPSVSLFSSVASADMTSFFKNVGCEGSTNAYSIVGSTPLIDSLFSVRYALYNNRQLNPRIQLKDFSGETFLYENPYTLPLGFMMPDIMETGWKLDLPNPIDVQNDLCDALDTPPVFETVMGENDGGTFSFTPEKDGEYYIYVMNHQVKSVKMAAREEIKTFDSLNRGYLVEVGYCKAGETVTLENKDNSDGLNAEAYLFKEEGLKAIYERLNANPFILGVWDDDYLEGNIDAGDGGTMFMSVPYDKGWTALVDGNPVTIKQIYGTFSGLELSAGRHTVVLKYMPKGLKLGAVISAAALLLLILLALGGWMFRKKRRKPTPYDRLDEEWHGESFPNRR